MIAIRLPEILENRLNILAKNTGRTKSFYIREAISEYMDDLEDIYEAEKEIENIRSGKSTVTPLAEVIKRYGL